MRKLRTGRKKFRKKGAKKLHLCVVVHVHVLNENEKCFNNLPDCVAHHLFKFQPPITNGKNFNEFL